MRVDDSHAHAELDGKPVRLSNRLGREMGDPCWAKALAPLYVLRFI